MVQTPSEDSRALYPMLLNATLHVKVWGGRKLDSAMNKYLPTADPYGESWELHDTSTVTNGALVGKTLGDVLAQYGTALVGEGNDPAEGFPLLAKILDATDWLSIQVHPDDAQAAQLEGQSRGKTEAWIILAADVGAKLVIGVEPGTSRESMVNAIKDNNLEDHIVIADVVAGDVLYIPAGTVHAIGPGILLYEIQQSSNTTYRLYDWGRMGLDGNPRDLHIEKGVQVANIETVPKITHTANDTSDTVTMVSGEFFTTVLHRLNDSTPLKLDSAGQFHTLTCIRGLAEVTHNAVNTMFGKGQTVLIPASLGNYSLTGDADVLRSWQGDS